MTKNARNIDPKTVESFGDEWSTHDQSTLDEGEHRQILDDYFGIFPWESLPDDAEGFDMGCGSGRWAKKVAPRVGRLHCIDPAEAALAVARRNLSGQNNAVFHHASTETAPLAPRSQDFGYSLGVLHHIPDTSAAMANCVSLLKPGAPFLVYLYYRFDNRPGWYAGIWKASELVRATVSRLPPRAKGMAADFLACTLYWPLARAARLAEKLGVRVDNFPLSVYRDKSFMTMRTDSRDRFGTPLEQRFTRKEITAMMEQAGLVDIDFSDTPPFWVAVGRKG